MSHVDYLCPACNARMGVSRGGSSLDPLDWVTCQNCKRPIRFHYLVRDSRLSILKGEGPSSRPSILLLKTDSVAATDLVVPAVTVRAGCVLHVAVAQLANLAAVNTVCNLDWNGHTLTQRSLVNAGNDAYLSTFSYAATATETGDLSILNGDTAMIRTTAQVFEVGLVNIAAPLDLPVTEAVNLAPASAAQNTTQLTTKDLELIVANLLVAEASSPDGTWQSPIVSGIITNGTGISDGGTNGFRMHEGHRNVTGKANYTMRKSFPSNVDWGLVITKFVAS